MRHIITTAVLLFLYFSPLCYSVAFASSDVSSETEAVKEYNDITAKYLELEPEHKNEDKVTRRISEVDSCRLNKLIDQMSNQDRFKNNFVVTKDRRLLTIGELLMERLNERSKNYESKNSSRPANDPILVFIDNKVSDIDITGFFSRQASVKYFAALINIKPDDIVSIELLNPVPSHVAQWASMAKGGVLLVTTKKSRK